MPLYDKPIWALVKQAMDELPDVFTMDQVIDWFHAKYPRVKDGSIRVYVIGMSVNSPTRRHYTDIHPYGVIYKLDRSHYTRYDPTRHGNFDLFGRQQGVTEIDTPEMESADGAELLTPDQRAEVAEFALEQHLEEFMERNWAQIDFGRPLDIWVDEDDTTGRQYPTDVGFIDFLCRDRATLSFVVVELKRGKTSDVVVGQCQRYMGWVKRNLATKNQDVEGLVICNEIDDKLRYALEVAPAISVRVYRVKFELMEPDHKDL